MNPENSIEDKKEQEDLLQDVFVGIKVSFSAGAEINKSKNSSSTTRLPNIFGSTTPSFAFGSSTFSLFGTGSTCPAFGSGSTCPAFGSSTCSLCGSGSTCHAFGSSACSLFGSGSTCPALGSSKQQDYEYSRTPQKEELANNIVEELNKNEDELLWDFYSYGRVFKRQSPPSPSPKEEQSEKTRAVMVTGHICRTLVDLIWSCKMVDKLEPLKRVFRDATSSRVTRRAASMLKMADIAINNIKEGKQKPSFSFGFDNPNKSFYSGSSDWRLSALADSLILRLFKQIVRLDVIWRSSTILSGGDQLELCYQELKSIELYVNKLKKLEPAAISSSSYYQQAFGSSLFGSNRSFG